MKIEYKVGDVIAGTESIIIHGCNSLGVMGRGVALAIKEELPWAFEVYLAKHNADKAQADKDKLPFVGMRCGTVVWAINIKTGLRPRIVGNAITQRYWQSTMGVNGRNADYEAIKAAIQEVDRFVLFLQEGSVPALGDVTRVSMPRIGAGLGGGSWAIISTIIEAESQHFTPVVYELP